MMELILGGKVIKIMDNEVEIELYERKGGVKKVIGKYTVELGQTFEMIQPVSLIAEGEVRGRILDELKIKEG